MAPANSEYVRAAKESIEDEYVGEAVKSVAGILLALRADYEGGYLRTLEELVRADLFADFLEMAVELNGKGYRGPAAVVAGSVLEGHLRNIAAGHSVDIETDGKPFSASRVNDELARAGAYTKLEAKEVSAWQGLRNSAAHGDYDDFDQEQVTRLIDGIRSFLVKHPA